MNFIFTPFGSGFKFTGQAPVDSRITADNIEEIMEDRDGRSQFKYSWGTPYDGLQVYLRDDGTGNPARYIFKLNPQNPDAAAEYDFIFIPDETVGGGGGISGSGAIVVPDDQRFADETARDDFFAANPSRLVDGTYVVIDEDPIILQKYNEGDNIWLDVSVVIRGPRGEDGDDGSDGLDGSGVVFVDNEDELPEEPNTDALYVDRDTNKLLWYDENENEYVQVIGGGADSWEVRNVDGSQII